MHACMQQCKPSLLMQAKINQRQLMEPRRPADSATRRIVPGYAGGSMPP